MIIFSDLSEVLLNGIIGVENFIDQHYGMAVAKQFIERKNETKESFEELLRGCITENHFWDLFFSSGDWPLGVPEIKTIVSLNLAKEIPGTYDVYCNITRYPKSIKSDHSVRSRINGRPEFWLVSDHIAEREQELEHLHPEIFELFSRCIWSFDEVAIKKDPGFFHRLIKHNGLDPDEIIFIDDSMDNITAAAKAGIHPLWVRNSYYMRHVLRRRGFGFAKTSPEDYNI